MTITTRKIKKKCQTKPLIVKTRIFQGLQETQFKGSSP